MNDYTSKRKREDVRYLSPELVSSSYMYQRPGKGFITTPFSSGRFMEAEPPKKRIHPVTEQTVLPNTGYTRTLDRGATSGTNNLLSNEQIQNFITSTVLPHHRTLINPNGMRWSQNQPQKRTAQQTLTAKVEEWNYAPTYPAFGVRIQASKQVFPMPSNVAQGAQRGAIKGTQRHPPSFSMGVNVPQETQEETILIRKGTQDEVSFIPNGISVPHGTQEDIILITEGTQKEVICIPKGNSFTQSTHELRYGPKERSISVSHGTQEFNYIPRGNINSLDEIILSPRGISDPHGTQGRPIFLQSPPADGLSDGVDCKRPQTLDTLVQGVPTNDVSAQCQQDDLFHHVQPRVMIPQTVPTKIEQNLKKTPVSNVHEPFTDTQTDSESLLVNGSRTRAAEVFANASQFVEVAQDTVNQKPELETLHNQKTTRQQIEAELSQILGELVAESPSTTQQVGKTTKDVDNDTVMQIQDTPGKNRKRKRKICSRVSSMKRQKVNRRTEDDTSDLESKSEAGEKIWSENITDHDEFIEDAIKILRGQSSDMFSENVIDQLFQDTFESDILLTSGDDFVMDPLFFLSPEFEHGVGSL